MLEESAAKSVAKQVAVLEEKHAAALEALRLELTPQAGDPVSSRDVEGSAARRLDMSGVGDEEGMRDVARHQAAALCPRYSILPRGVCESDSGEKGRKREWNPTSQRKRE